MAKRPGNGPVQQSRTDGEGSVPTRGTFPRRREATEAELGEARGEAARIHGLAVNGATPAMIAKIVKLPVAAIDMVLSEPLMPTAEKSGNPSIPVGATEDSRPPTWGTVPWGMGTPVRPSTGIPVVAATMEDELGRIVRLAGGSDAISRLVAERFSFLSPDDYDGLEKILMEAGATVPTTRSVLGLYRSRTGEPESAARKSDREDDPLARLRHHRAESLEERYFEAEIKRAEREAQGGNEGDGGEWKDRALKAEAALDRKQLTDGIAQAIESQLAPLRTELREVKSSIGSANTIDQVKVAAARSKIDLEAEAATRALNIAAAKLEKTGAVQRLAEKLSTGPLSDKLAERLLAVFEKPAVPGESATAEDLAARTAQMEAQLRAEGLDPDTETQ